MSNKGYRYRKAKWQIIEYSWYIDSKTNRPMQGDGRKPRVSSYDQWIHDSKRCSCVSWNRSINNCTDRLGYYIKQVIVLRNERRVSRKLQAHLEETAKFFIYDPLTHKRWYKSIKFLMKAAIAAYEAYGGADFIEEEDVKDGCSCGRSLYLCQHYPIEPDNSVADLAWWQTKNREGSMGTSISSHDVTHHGIAGVYDQQGYYS